MRPATETEVVLLLMVATTLTLLFVRGWRSLFWTVAVLSIASLVSILALLVFLLAHLYKAFGLC